MTDLYERVRYTGFPFPQTHPDRLALLARMHGLAPAAPEGCRVLEVGCADGVNLLGMAASEPGLEAVGIDSAGELVRALRRGEAVLPELPARHAAQAGAFPEVSPLARAMAREGPDLVSAPHEHVRVEDPLARRLIVLLDGTRDRAALVDALVEAAGEEDTRREEIAGGLEHRLRVLAGLGLLRA